LSFNRAADLCLEETTAQSLSASVVTKISTKDVDVLGVTAIGDKLFVLLSRSNKQVAVHSISDYRLL